MPTWAASTMDTSISSGCAQSSSGTTSAVDVEPGGANSVTSWPRDTSPPESSRITSSMPP